MKHTFPLHGGATWSADFEGDSVSFDFSQLTIEALAFGLSHVNRFCGAAGRYSVAEHSYWLSMEYRAPEMIAFALLHDASEALGAADANGWLKKKLCPQIRDFEKKVIDAVLVHFLGEDHGIREGFQVGIKNVDGWLGDYEAQAFGFPVETLGRRFDFSPKQWKPKKAARQFLDRWRTACQARNGSYYSGSRT